VTGSYTDSLPLLLWGRLEATDQSGGMPLSSTRIGGADENVCRPPKEKPSGSDARRHILRSRPGGLSSIGKNLLDRFDLHPAILRPAFLGLIVTDKVLRIFAVSLGRHPILRHALLLQESHHGLGALI
jgi:hypothetical protein